MAVCSINRWFSFTIQTSWHQHLILHFLISAEDTLLFCLWRGEPNKMDTTTAEEIIEISNQKQPPEVFCKKRYS